MGADRPNEDFYVLEDSKYPGNYEQDTQFGSTQYVLYADRYDSLDEAKKVKELYPPDSVIIRRVHIEVLPI